MTKTLTTSVLKRLASKPTLKRSRACLSRWWNGAMAGLNFAQCTTITQKPMSTTENFQQATRMASYVDVIAAMLSPSASRASSCAARTVGFSRTQVLARLCILRKLLLPQGNTHTQDPAMGSEPQQDTVDTTLPPAPEPDIPAHRGTYLPEAQPEACMTTTALAHTTSDYAHTQNVLYIMSEQSTQQQPRWNCPKCNVANVARHTKCHGCNAPQPNAPPPTESFLDVHQS